ncbi:hypothetical protein INT43_006242 [Umbelopsis isabellina]|uniref:Uncharacterized protein n=1 Tax=Mortierella isabellina TaxID=91625 RepID=A0A8H7Q0Q3_MORIS|nr:hypothetical protein INT43_006242 [Umbelopsis isabellina]
MSQALHFESSFWSQKFTGTNVPEYQQGLRILHDKLAQSKTENDEVIAFLRERVSLEESYAVKLTDQGQQRQKSRGFLRDEGATLKKGFDSLRAASELLGSQHMELALNIHDVVLKPLLKMNDEYKTEVSSAKRNIDMKFKQFDNSVKDMDRLKNYYIRKCRDADRAEEQAVLIASETAKNIASQDKTESSDSSIQDTDEKEEQSEDPQGQRNEAETTSPALETEKQETFTLAGQVYSASEFEGLIAKMRQEIPVGEHKIAIFGTYQNTSTGENIARWLQQNVPVCKDSPAAADLIGQQLISAYHVFKLIGQLGDKFVPSSSSIYQWKTIQTSPEIATNGYATSALEGVSGFFGKFGNTISSNASTIPGLPNSGVPGEEPYKIARQEAVQADVAYEKSVRKLDNVRLQLEQLLFAHFSEMEQLEIDRISTIKRAFIEFGALMSNTLPTSKAIYEQMLLYQQTLKPDQDIQYIIQQYFVSGFAPKAVLYENFYHGHALDQSFGVSLIDDSKTSETGIPKIVQLFLNALEEKTKNMSLPDVMAVWATPVALDKVHIVRNELNVPIDQLNDNTMETYDPALLAGTLRLYLRELPESVVTSELYEAIKSLYTDSKLIMSPSDNQEEAVRVQAVAKLLTTMPKAHYTTLKALMGHFDSKLKGSANNKEQPHEVGGSNDFLTKIGQAFGSLLLWPRYATYTTTMDRHLAHLVRDFLSHYDTIFSEDMTVSNTESEKRRLETTIVTDKLGNYQGTVPEPTSPSRRRGLMSLDAAKQGASSMFGAFNRASSSDPPPLPPKNSGSTSSNPLGLVSPPTPSKTPDAFVIADEQTMTPGLDGNEEPDVMFDATEEQEKQITMPSTKPEELSKLATEEEMGLSDQAGKQYSSAQRIEEIDDVVPKDKDGNDIDPFFEDD